MAKEQSMDGNKSETGDTHQWLPGERYPWLQRQDRAEEMLANAEKLLAKAVEKTAKAHKKYTHEQLCGAFVDPANGGLPVSKNSYKKISKQAQKAHFEEQISRTEETDARLVLEDARQRSRDAASTMKYLQDRIDASGDPHAELARIRRVVGMNKPGFKTTVPGRKAVWGQGPPKGKKAKSEPKGETAEQPAAAAVPPANEIGMYPSLGVRPAAMLDQDSADLTDVGHHCAALFKPGETPRCCEDAECTRLGGVGLEQWQNRMKLDRVESIFPFASPTSE
jgi:Tat protein secretion system quality control protein TatD with DNase activity